MKPSKEIASFLRELPSQIAEVVCLQIWQGTARPADHRPDTGKQLVHDTIGYVDTIPALEVAKTVVVAALIDFALSRPVFVDAERVRAAAEKTGSQVLMKVALAMPLADRYFQQAQSKWQRLRSTTLSLAFLHEFESVQMDELSHGLRVPP
jgi:hypothetical protein